MYGEAPMSKIAIAAVSILLLLCGSRPGPADAATTSHAAEKSSAIAAADAWLKIVDSGNYDESWKQASSLFKNSVSEDQWTQKLGPPRQVLGSVVSRKVKSAKYMTSMPGAPDAQYVVIQYQTLVCTQEIGNRDCHPDAR
jgi:hypothetical protein